MNKNSILFVSPDFDLNQCSIYKLILKIGIDNFSYSVVNPNTKQLLALYDEQECENANEKFLATLNEDEKLRMSYAEVYLFAQPNNFLIIPTEFSNFQTNSFVNYLPDKDFNQINIQKTDNKDVNYLFTLPKKVEVSIKNQWKSTQLGVQFSGLIQLTTTIKEDCIFIDFTVNSFQFIYTKQGKLIACQHYTFDNTEELIYYLLLNKQLLAITTEQLIVYVCGIIHRDDEKWQSLEQHFGNIKLLIIDNQLDNTIIDDMPPQYYSSLLSLM